MAIASALLSRQLLAGSRGSMQRAVTTARIGTLSDDTLMQPFAIHDGPVLAIDIDPVDERYLLAVDSRARVTLYDLASRDDNSSGHDDAAPARSGQSPQFATPLAQFPVSTQRREGSGRAASTSSRRNSSSSASTTASQDVTTVLGHSSSISCVQWYPVDAGLFVTGGFDCRVVGWDANTFQPAYGWQLDGKVYCLCTSPIAATHALVGAATDDSRVRLIDLATMGFTHTLLGHTDAVLCVAWSPVHEFVLATGSRDGTVRLWDVRKSGASACLTHLDVNSERPRLRGGGGVTAAAASASSASFSATASANSPAAPPASYSIRPGSGRAHVGGVNALIWGPLVSASQPATLLTSGADSLLRSWEVDVLTAPAVSSSAVATSLRASSTSAPGDSAISDLSGARAYLRQRTYPGVRNAFRHTVWPAIARMSGAQVLFFPNASAAASSTGPGRGGGISVYDASTGALQGELQGHQGSVNALVFRRPMSELVSCGDDGMLLRWSSGLLAPGRQPRTGTGEMDTD